MSINFYIENSSECLNFTNSNACAMLAAMGVDPAGYGELSGSSLDNARECLFNFVNRKSHRAPHRQDDYIDGNFTSFGRNDEYLVRRGSELLQLMVGAQKRGRLIYWG